MNYDMKQSGKRIRQLRIQGGYTQEVLASKLNINRSALSRIEAGRSECPVDILVQLSCLFGVSLDYLVLGAYNTDSIGDVEKAAMLQDIDNLMLQLQRIKSTF